MSVQFMLLEHAQICKISECFLGKDCKPAGHDEGLHMWMCNVVERLKKESEIEDYKMWGHIQQQCPHLFYILIKYTGEWK